jgi:hypothetical protein
MNSGIDEKQLAAVRVCEKLGWQSVRTQRIHTLLD